MRLCGNIGLEGGEGDEAPPQGTPAEMRLCEKLNAGIDDTRRPIFQAPPLRFEVMSNK